MKTQQFIYLGLLILCFSCDNSTNSAQSSESTTTNNVDLEASKDTDSNDPVPMSDEEKLAKLVSNTAKELYEDWERGDSIRDANEPHRWVYVVGDSYDDEDLAAEAYGKLKESEPDIYVFKKKRKKFYVIKGAGLATRKPLDDSLEAVQTRLNTRLDVIDLSKACRKMPINTDPIKYKADGEKQYANCKKCE